ncbi:hypothetical protein BB561_004458 [Smittium simulii]|uniref:Uncharacterized protein n=1 Tax=Smittium simulii TaxID=133385 RepID=A0A2T9YG71_9FUNG|nr:hypothetical protein BB561_004458 [Smittium simulii]
MPKFCTEKPPINDINEFISAFENCMRMNGLTPDVHGARLLRNRVPVSLVWVDMIPIMREIFGDPEKESKLLLKSVTQFSKRFQKAFNEANLRNTGKGAVKKFIMCLPDIIKWSIKAAIIKKKLRSDFITAFQFAIRFLNSNSAISKYSKEKKISNVKKGKIYCTFHKSNSHNTTECYTNKNNFFSTEQNLQAPTNNALNVLNAQAFLDRLVVENQEEYTKFTNDISRYDKEKTAIKNELSILQNTLPKHIQPLIEDKDQREGINPNEDIDLYYVPKDMPLFRSESDSIYDIEESIYCFENCMTMNGLEPKVHGARLIASCLEYSDLQWLQTRVPNSSTWIEMIPIMIEIFGDPDKESKSLNELWTIKPYPNESILKNNEKPKLPGSDQASIKKFIFCLPDPIKWSIEAGIMEKRINTDFITISQYAMRFSNSNSNKVNDTSGNGNFIRKNQISYGLNKKYCTVHKTNSHNTADCNTIKKKVKTIPSHLIQTENEYISEKPSSKVSNMSETNIEIKKIYNKVNAIGTKTHNNDFIFSIMICRKEMMAELDTTADVSCMPERLVTELDIPCNNVTGYNIMANSDIKIPRNKETIKVRVKTDKAELFTNFEVISKISNSQVLIRKDIINQLKLNIFGLPFKYLRELEDYNAINDETTELVTGLRNPLIEENELNHEIKELYTQ